MQREHDGPLLRATNVATFSPSVIIIIAGSAASWVTRPSGDAEMHATAAPTRSVRHQCVRRRRYPADRGRINSSNVLGDASPKVLDRPAAIARRTANPTNALRPI